MSSKLLTSISLLSLATFIFAFSAYATCLVDAYTDCRAVLPLKKKASAGITVNNECSGSYSIWAVVGDDNKSDDAAFYEDVDANVIAEGWILEEPYDAFATIYTSQGFSDNSSCP